MLIILFLYADKLLDAHGSMHMTLEALTQQVFASEVLTLSRLIYKCRNQLRNWKGFSRLKQVLRWFMLVEVCQKYEFRFVDLL